MQSPLRPDPPSLNKHRCGDSSVPPVDDSPCTQSMRRMELIGLIHSCAPPTESRFAI